jgi:hypothetical protein
MRPSARALSGSRVSEIHACRNAIKTPKNAQDVVGWVLTGGQVGGEVGDGVGDEFNGGVGMKRGCSKCCYGIEGRNFCW